MGYPLLELDDEAFITAFQKTLKCTLKAWGNLPFNKATEVTISDNRILVRPFPYVSRDPFSVLLDTASDPDYTSKRGMTYMYVAKAGYGRLSVDDKKLNIKAIKKEAESVCVVDPQNRINAQVDNIDTPLSVTELNEIADPKNSYIDYDKWMRLLTENQSRFVTKVFNGHERLEGAAGTGKTLTLMLRAIYLFKLHQAKDEDFHIIFVAHSMATKGRAKEDIEKYKVLPRLECTMPISAIGDYHFVFLLFEKYQQTLYSLGYFDNDDISLSALGQLDTPIWRRRRKEIGFDVIIIDETHLFSYNELSLFHYLSKESAATKIL